MNTADRFLALLLVTSLTAVAQVNPTSPETTEKPAAEAPTKLSPAVSKVLTEQLPKYSPPPPAKPKPAPDPDVLELPKLTITQKKRPRLGEDVILTTKAFNEKLAKEKLSSLDRDFLNRFSLPSWFGGVSAAERAREEYNREKRAQMVEDVFALAKVVEVQDPEQAKALRDAASKP
jgi:hypothetical protein